MILASAVLIAAAAVLAAAASHALARFIIDRAIAPDRPNGRSSHNVSTPRAGGFAIATAFAASMALVAAHDFRIGVQNAHYAPLLCCGLAAFLFGAIDDFRAIGAKLKLAAQAAIAVSFVSFVGPVPSIPLPFVGDVALSLAAFPLTVFWIVAFMNAFNFMDGVNGIAGSCAIFVLSAIAVAAASAPGDSAGVPALLLACAIFGFLPLNYPSGRIFMGDGGSQFIGFMIAALAVLISKAPDGAVSAMFTPLAFMPFLFDVLFTLTHRLRRGRNVFEAHNEHVYQLMVRLGRPHRGVTAIYLTLTVISTSVAILTNAADPRWQFLSALLLVGVFLAPALIVYRRAERAGMLPSGVGKARASEKSARGVPVAAE